MRTTQQIANRLIELCRELKFVEAYQELYAEDAESIDPIYANQSPSKGLINLIEREKKFLTKAQITNRYFGTVDFGKSFRGHDRHGFDHEDRGHIHSAELAVYRVKDGKIISQQFFMG